MDNRMYIRLKYTHILLVSIGYFLVDSVMLTYFWLAEAEPEPEPIVTE
jgi:hypothetical protein